MDLAFFVKPEDYFIALRLKFLLIDIPVEGVQSIQGCDAVLSDQHGPFFVDFLGLDPSPAFVYCVGRLHCPLADAVGVVDVPVHVDPVGGDVQVLDSAIAIMVEHDNVLGVLQVRGLGALPPGPSGKVHVIEFPDEIIREFPPVIQRPADGLLLCRGDLDPEGGAFQVFGPIQFLPKLFLQNRHPRPDRGRGEVLREAVDFDDFRQVLFGGVTDGVVSVRYG